MASRGWVEMLGALVGTEAAAVTSVQVRLTSADRKPVARMIVDRPYIFFIQDSQSGNIMFAGKVVDL